MSTPEASARYEAARLYEEARVRREQGNPSGAMARYTRVLALADALGDARCKAELLAEIARMHQEACDVLAARRWFEEALAAYQALGDVRSCGEMSYGLAMVEQVAGDPAAAEGRYREALEQFQAAHDPAGEGTALAGLGLLVCDLKRENEGLNAVASGLRILHDADPAGEARIREQLRDWRGRIGSARFRTLLGSAVGDPALRDLLRDERVNG